MENEVPEDDDTGPESRTLGTLKKKKEALARLRREYLMKVKACERDMATIEAAMRVFDPRGWAGRQEGAKKAQRRKHIAVRFILDFLRESKEPVLASAITLAWLAEQKMEPDAQNKQVYGQRVSTALSNLKRKGVAEPVYEPGERPLWRLTDNA